MTNDAAVPEGAHEQIVAIFANELCHPLAPIRDAAALLQQEAVDTDTVLRAAHIIERQANDMHRLIGDLIDVSRMQVGVLEMRVTTTLLSELVERAVETATPFVRERGHTLSVSVSAEPVYLSIDVLRVSQAVHNIIVNASKFTDRDGYIHVRAQREDETVVIVVRDTGIGIPANYLESIFDLFWRCEQRDRIEPGGAGSRPLSVPIPDRGACRHGDGGERRTRLRQRIYRAPALRGFYAAAGGASRVGARRRSVSRLTTA